MIDLDYFVVFILVLVRLTSFFSIVKVMFPTGTPKQLKAFLGIIFALILVPGVQSSGVTGIENIFILIKYVIFEVATGVTLAIITNVVFEVIIMAGSLIDVHIGLSMITLLDPTSKINASLTGNLLNYVSLMLFFIVDGHHILIKALMESFVLVPLGKTIMYQEKMMELIEIISKYFLIGLKIAIPIVLIIIVTDLCMGMVSRAVPQINVMVLGMPIKLTVGLIALVISLPIIIKFITSVFSYLPDVLRDVLRIAPVMFIFADEKTEEATPKKKSDARKKGQIARSKNVGLALSMIVCTLVILVFSDFIINGLKENTIYYLSEAGTIGLTESSIEAIRNNVFSRLALGILPVTVPIMIAGIIASLMQTGFIITGEPLKPSFSKMNPINGFKNMFSAKSFVELIKNLAIVIIISVIGYLFIKDNFNSILQVSNIYLPSLGVEIKSLIISIFFKVTIVMVALAAIDYLVQFKLHNKELRMTKQEIKEEYKQMEGDPQVKSKIKQKQREMSQKRMMQSISEATVVITNPTHIAVAIKYIEGEMEAPVLLAKGAENIAFKIKEKAKEHEIPIIENKPLARMIYKEVEIEQEIPQEMYQAIAEILIMVYKLKKK